MYKVTSNFQYEDQDTGNVKAKMTIEHFDCDYANLVQIETQMDKYVQGLFQLGRDALAQGESEKKYR